MKYWTRTTHNFNNETREWEYVDRPYNRANFSRNAKSTLGIHALISGRWQSLYEIVDENRQYYEQFKDDPWSGVDEKGHSEESVLHDLELMEKLGLVKSKEL